MCASCAWLTSSWSVSRYDKVNIFDKVNKSAYFAICGGSVSASALRPYQGPLAEKAIASHKPVLRGPAGANRWGLCYFVHDVDGVSGKIRGRINPDIGPRSQNERILLRQQKTRPILPRKQLRYNGRRSLANLGVILNVFHHLLRQMREQQQNNL